MIRVIRTRFTQAPAKVFQWQCGAWCGIFRTTDGGATWTQLTATGTSDFYYVNDLVISNANPQRLYAGTRTGVWRSLNGGAAYKSAATVSAASYANSQPVAAESIVSVFGANLATRDQAVKQLPLPTELAGTSVKVRDSLGIERLAQLFYVGKLQVNYEIPAGTATGFATVTITNGNGEIFTSAVNITSVTPGLFAANQNGSGAAAASILYFRNGTSRYESNFACDTNGQNCTARQIDLNAADEVFLELYGTGIRNNSRLTNVTATVGGVTVPVLYANKQPDFIGLDQVNIQLPKMLVGRGEVDVVLTVDGKVANPVRINLK